MIFIISSEKDLHTQAVLAALRARGHNDVRVVDLGEFPMQMDVSLTFHNDSDSQFALRFADGKRVAMSEVEAVWWRRPQPYGLPAEMTDPVNRSFAMQEADFAFKGIWACSNAMWMNDVNRDSAASNKPWQLEVAKKLGLSVPRTLITNSPLDARRFSDESAGKVIYKAFLASAMAWRETRVLRPEDMAMIDSVKLAPVIFQSYVEATHDLRVTVVGEQIFAAGAMTGKGEYQADIRMNMQVDWQPYTLPDDVADKLLKLMKFLGLQYGAVDFRVTPEGEHVFLEINPAGQFLFIENATGMKISEAMAEHLITAGG